MKNGNLAPIWSNFNIKSEKAFKDVKQIVLEIFFLIFSSHFYDFDL